MGSIQGASSVYTSSEGTGPTQRDDEDELTRSIVTLAGQYGRYGYRRITALLRRAGWNVGKDRAERIWRREGLKVPKKQKPRGRLWLNDGSCVRLRPERTNHVWSYDFVSAKTHDGRTVRMLNLIDEHTRESLLVRPERRWSSAKVIEALADVMVMKGVPEHIRSHNGPEFVARDLRQWLAVTGAETLYIEPGSPCPPTAQPDRPRLNFGSKYRRLCRFSRFHQPISALPSIT